jgi:hypothetical protein
MKAVSKRDINIVLTWLEKCLELLSINEKLVLNDSLQRSVSLLPGWEQE